MAQWLKVEPKQSTLFLSIQISFSIMEEEVHAIGELECEATLAWQTRESKSFFKETFSFDIKSKSFEIEIILFFNESFSFKTKTSFKDRTSFSSKHFHNHFYFSKSHFLLWQVQVGISMSPFHLKSHPSLAKPQV